MMSSILRIRKGLLLSALCAFSALQGCNKQAEEAIAPVAVVGQAEASWRGTVPAPCTTVDLVAGQHTRVGRVEVASVPANNGQYAEAGLVVTYIVTTPGLYLSEIHADAFTSEAELKAAKKISGGGAIPGKFAFKQAAPNTQTQTISVFIPQSYLTSFGGCFFIATHAALSNGETAWGGLSRPVGTTGNVSLDVAKQFSGNNWSVYFEFCRAQCTQDIDFTYAWEDQQFRGNDSDYNDLVMQSTVIKSDNELKIDFLATARGTAFDHIFKFKIPKAGIVVSNGVAQIFGAAAITEDATSYYVTVFESTRAALPPGNGTDVAFSANTQPSQTTCVPYKEREIRILVNSSFAYNPNKPYEPFISVFTSASVDRGPSYDLYIYEVSGRDVWTDNGNVVLPNGILIPSDWQWPVEFMNVRTPYPGFSSFVFPTGFGIPTWASGSPVGTNTTFNKSFCN